MVVECDGQGNTDQFEAWLADNGGAEASDECSEVVWTFEVTPLTDDCGATGTATAVWTATDDCGNFSTTTATFTIEDTTAPDPVCQDITIQLDGNCFASITPEDIDNGSSDICGDIANLELDITEFTCIDDVGDNTVTLTVTDECGNEDECQAIVTVEQFDLALRTILAPGEDERVYPGEDITFKIEVHNQGTLTASNIEITDYIPDGLALNDPAWSQSGGNACLLYTSPSPRDS